VRISVASNHSHPTVHGSDVDHLRDRCPTGHDLPMTLRWRVTLAAAAATAIALIVAGLVIIQLTERDNRNALDNQVAFQASRIAQNLVRLAGSAAGPLVQRAGAGSVEADRSVRLVASDGTLELALGQTLPGQVSLIAPGLSTVTVGGASYSAFAVDVDDGRTRAQAQVLAPLAPLQQQNDRFRRRMLGVGLLAVVAAIVIAWLLSSAALSSLLRLRRRAEQAAATSDTTQRMPEAGPPEVVALGAAFNSVLARLHGSSGRPDRDA
jgi:methyl-accepting chemotaxis protein